MYITWHAFSVGASNPYVHTKALYMYICIYNVSTVCMKTSDAPVFDRSPIDSLNYSGMT